MHTIKSYHVVNASMELR